MARRKSLHEEILGEGKARVCVQGPMLLHGMEDQIDVMIEAKCKERALLRFRGIMKQPPTEDAVMATKFV